MPVEFSSVDKARGVKLPGVNNKLLAYETGVHIGDGSLQIVPASTHSVRYWGHGENDWEFVSRILPVVIKKLYNKQVIARKCNDSNKCVLAVCSKAVATFKRDVLRLPVGKKEQLKGLPDFVKTNRQLLVNCLKGIADTDFTLYELNNGLPAIECCMSNRGLIIDIHEQLLKLGFNVKLELDRKRIRNEKQHIEHRVRLFGKHNLKKWMKDIGFSNPAYLRKVRYFL